MATVAGVLAIAGCGPTTPTAPPSGSEASVPSAIVSSPPSNAGTIVVDGALLDLLPTEIAGVPLNEDSATAAEIVADRALVGSVVGVAVATGFGPMPTATTPDYVVVTLARLETGVFDDAFFRDWRDSFDQAVCAQAGGVDGHAEAEVDGHQTFIATCAGGVRTYHVYLPASDVIVSMQAAGDGRFGERVVEGLTE